MQLRLAAVLFIVLACTIPAPAFALTGTGVLAGRVLDAQTGLPLAHAIVTLPESTQSAFTDAAGDFHIPNLGLPYRSIYFNYMVQLK